MPDPNTLFRLSVVALVASSVSLAACQRKTEPVPAAPAAPAEPPASPAPVLSRADLLQAMREAAAAYVDGGASQMDNLSGRRFLIRQAFGCAGVLPEAAESVDGVAALTQADALRSVELHLTPGDWTKSGLIAAAAPGWEAAEGFWLVRPWQKSEACPVVKPDPLASGPPTPSSQTMGLAAVFQAGSSRLGRRNGRAYSYELRQKDSRPAVIPETGFRLVLEGRLSKFPDGRAIHCRAASPDQRPVCIVAAQLDRVAFEDGDGATLSDWRAG